MWYNEVMDPTFYKADVFFVITTLAVVLVTVILLLGLGYVVQILASINRIMKQAERTTEHVAEDIDTLRSDLRNNGLSFGAFTRFFTGVRKKHNKRRSR